MDALFVALLLALGGATWALIGLCDRLRPPRKAAR